MAVSDVDTSAVESERLPSISSIGGSWSESTCGIQERRFSCDLRNKTEKPDAYPTDTSSKGGSSDEKINSQRSSIMQASYSETEVFSSTIPGRVRKKSGLQRGETSNVCCCKYTDGSIKKSSGRRHRHMNSIIVEEKDPGEETETDGCVSEVECGRRWSSISRSTSRRKRFSKRRFTYSDMVRLSRSGNMLTSNDQDLPLTQVDESSLEGCDK
ncbi:uncharacterized protein LOC124265286 [Haliotis rubra]|uniref:uncharacterized protein LOC124265286 n=1 Tax=Haliotis rubra TaxID=36100 RepID=UPI001EE53686|nr:uncharacterized protein LOC124265286 [Haliotis rubra]